MQAVQGVAPPILVHQIVPFGNQVVDGTTAVGLTKRNAAVHTACTLRLQMVALGLRKDLQEVVRSLDRIAVRYGLTREFFKARWFAHDNDLLGLTVIGKWSVARRHDIPVRDTTVISVPDFLFHALHQHAFVVGWHDLDEMFHGLGPLLQQFGRDGRARVLFVQFQHF